MDGVALLDAVALNCPSDVMRLLTFLICLLIDDETRLPIRESTRDRVNVLESGHVTDIHPLIRHVAYARCDGTIVDAVILEVVILTAVGSI